MINKPIQQQTKHLIDILSKNSYIMAILDSKPFPKGVNWYLGAGSICQSVWNYLSSEQVTSQIKDYDLVYYDDTNISYEAENVFIQKGNELFGKLPVEVEIRNQARVHVWFEKRFGKKN